MKIIGIISGTVTLHDRGIFANLRKETVETPFGRAVVFCSERLLFIARHGIDPSGHILPHLINHQANLAALKMMGVDEVIGVNSCGSMKKDIPPGAIVIPDDYISLGAQPTTVGKRPLHIVPKLDEEIRQKLLSASQQCGVEPFDGGIYWQSPGPRLETRAEIAMLSQFADIIGMTLASEAVIAQELDIRYASICSADNYAHGLGDGELSMETIRGQALGNAKSIERILTCYVEQASQPA